MGTFTPVVTLGFSLIFFAVALAVRWGGWVKQNDF
jgi:hypothetical protein